MKSSEAEQEQEREAAKTMRGECRTTELARLYDRTPRVTRSVNTMRGECRTIKLAWLYDRTARVTRSVHTLCIDAFGIRFCASGLDSERVHYRDTRLERSSPL